VLFHGSFWKLWRRRVHLLSILSRRLGRNQMEQTKRMRRRPLSAMPVMQSQTTA
jgi:hypothetical protein